jgi:hypothetical protein
MIDTLQQSLTDDFDSGRAKSLCDSLRTHMHDPNFFSQPPLTFYPATAYVSVSEEIDWALSQMPLPATRVDSAARVVNYVFTHYCYGEASVLDPQSYFYSSMEIIGKEINSNHLAGICNSLAHFLGIILTTKFPDWGVPVDISAGAPGAMGHVFSGLTDAYGNVYMVLDPTVNIVWVDIYNRPLSLARIQPQLKTSPGMVRKFGSSVFGTKQKQLAETPCLLYSDCVSGSASAFIEPQSGSYVITADWFGLNDTSALGYRTLVAPYWKSHGFPGNTWANQCLMIEDVWCKNPYIGRNILAKYHRSF